MSGELLAELQALVRCDSPPADVPALHGCADLLAEIGTRRLGTQPIREGPVTVRRPATEGDRP